MQQRHTILAALVLMLASILALPSAYAAELGELKAQGIIGERADGYLGMVQNEVAPETKVLVDQINTQRNKEYQRIAQQNGIALAEVESLAGKKTLEKTARGDWIYIGSWRQK